MQEVPRLFQQLWKLKGPPRFLNMSGTHCEHQLDESQDQKDETCPNCCLVRCNTSLQVNSPLPYSNTSRLQSYPRAYTGYCFQLPRKSQAMFHNCTVYYALAISSSGGDSTGIPILEVDFFFFFLKRLLIEVTSGFTFQSKKSPYILLRTAQ